MAQEAVGGPDGKVLKLLELHEGRRTFPYRDTVGKLTIGIGFNLDDVGLLPEEIDFVLRNRVSLVRTRLEDVLPVFSTLDEVRQAVLIDMAYNLGTEGLLKFKMTLNSIRAGRYQEAAEMMLDSRWADQVGRRAYRLAEMMRTGQWPDDLL
jgi:lysozyme